MPCSAERTVFMMFMLTNNLHHELMELNPLSDRLRRDGYLALAQCSYPHNNINFYTHGIFYTVSTGTGRIGLIGITHKTDVFMFLMISLRSMCLFNKVLYFNFQFTCSLSWVIFIFSPPLFDHKTLKSRNLVR